MSDDLTLDFSDVKPMGGFDPLPRGWYVMAINDYDEVEVKNSGGKLPVGTPGTRWEFVVTEGEYENRKVWTNTWHARQNLGFLKALLAATGEFSEEELEGSLNVDDARERAVGSQLLVRLKIRPASGQYEASNDVAGYDNIANRDKRIKEGGASADSSLLP